MKGLPTQNIVVNTGNLKISTPEQLWTYFYIHKRVVELNHIATILSKLIDIIDANKLISLAKNFKSNAWIHRLAYILDKLDTWHETNKKSYRQIKKVIDKLKKYLDNRIKQSIPLGSKIKNDRSKHAYNKK